MCTSIIEIARAEGMAKRGDQWFPLSRTVVASSPIGGLVKARSLKQKAKRLQKKRSVPV